VSEREIDRLRARLHRIAVEEADQDEHDEHDEHDEQEQEEQ